MNTILNNEGGASVRGKLNEVTEVAPSTRYNAYISQAGTAAPSADVRANSVGSIVWTRIGVGEYRGTLSNAFANPILLINFRSAGGLRAADFYLIDQDTVAIETYAPVGALSDGVLDAFIEIMDY